MGLFASHCCGTTRPSGPTASTATWRRASRPVRGPARAWSPRLSTIAQQPVAPSPASAFGAKVRGASESGVSVVQDRRGWPRATPRHAGKAGNAAAPDNQNARPASGPAFEKTSEVREQHPPAGHEPTRPAHAVACNGNRLQARLPIRPFRPTVAIEVDACGRGSLEAWRRQLGFLIGVLASSVEQRQGNNVAGMGAPTPPTMPQVKGALCASGLNL